MTITLTGAKYSSATVVATTLNGAIAAGDTSIVLTSATGFKSPSGTVRIDSEEITYTGISTNTLTGCTRGANGTTAASHANGAAASAGSRYTVIVTAATFTVADFTSKQRLVALFNSAGTTFKGLAWVRQAVSTTELELIQQPFDPISGATFEKAASDTILVSKDYAECATTGLSVTENSVVLTDTITYGTQGTLNSLCFYDEFKSVRADTGTTAGTIHRFEGGVAVFGRLIDYASNMVKAGCQFHLNSSTQYVNFFGVGTGASAVVAAYDGAFTAKAPPAYIGARWSGSGAGYTIVRTAAAHTFLLSKCAISIDPISPDPSGDYGTSTWASNATRHVIRDCIVESGGNQATLSRFGNGVLEGGSFRILYGSNTALSMTGFGNGTWNITTPPNKRMVFADRGYGASLTRTGGVPPTPPGSNITHNFTNFITVTYNLSYGNTQNVLASDPGQYGNFYFEDYVSNTIAGTHLSIILDSTWVAATVVASSTGTDALKVLHRTVTGHSITNTYGPWTLRARKYGYDELEWAIASSDYDLGAAGTAKNVSIAKTAIQIPRTTLPSQSTADAVTGVSVTDHGASPVSWQSKSWSITITGNRTTNPSLTAALLWAYVKSQITKSTTWNGKAGYLWHVLVEENPSGAGYVTQRGVSGGAGATIKGVRVVDENGDPFPGIVQMTADDGTAYTPPLNITLTFSPLKTGSVVYVRKVSDDSILGYTDSSSGSSWIMNYAWSADVSAYYTIAKPGYKFIRSDSFTITSSNQSFPVFQVNDANSYSNP